jgi:hypothetical protein
MSALAPVDEDPVATDTTPETQPSTAVKPQASHLGVIREVFQRASASAFPTMSKLSQQTLSLKVDVKLLSTHLWSQLARLHALHWSSGSSQLLILMWQRFRHSCFCPYYLRLLAEKVTQIIRRGSDILSLALLLMQFGTWLWVIACKPLPLLSNALLMKSQSYFLVWAKSFWCRFAGRALRSFAVVSFGRTSSLSNVAHTVTCQKVWPNFLRFVSTCNTKNNANIMRMESR